MIISIDVEKTLDKIQYAFIRKNLSNVGTEGTYLSVAKATYGKPTARIILNRQNLQVFPLTPRTRQYMLLGILDRCIQKTNETRPSFYTKHKNKFNNDETLNIRPETMKILEENLGSTAQSQTLVIPI